MLSRAAESFFWIGRYIERTEYTARYTNVKFHLVQEIAGREDQQAIWQQYLEGTGDYQLFLDLYPQQGTYRFLEFVTTNSDNPNSQVNLIKEARANARSIQDELSSEVWRHLNNFYLTLKSKTSNDLINSPHEILSEIRDTCYTLDGVIGGTMIHDEGWNFYRLGKNVERANRTARLLDDPVLAKAEQETGDMADYHHCLSILKTASAFEAYRKFYSAKLVPRKIVRFLLFHNRFPRSVRFAAGAISSLLERLSLQSSRPEIRTIERLAGQIAADMKYGNLEDVYRTGLSEFITQIIDQLDYLTNQVAIAFFRSPGYTDILGISPQKPQKPLKPSAPLPEPSPQVHKSVLSVHHKFSYQYGEPVSQVTTVVRVFPAQHYGDQKRIDLWWHVEPPGDYRHFTDAFGNLVWQLDHDRIEQEIACSVDMRVETCALYHPDQTLALSGLPLHESDGSVQPEEFLQLTTLVNTSEDLTTLAKGIPKTRLSGPPLVESLLQHTADFLHYDREHSQAGLTVTQALDNKIGGSVDVAHVMLSLCRQAGLPARFVSGYHPHEARMHAWVEVLLPLGNDQILTWVAYDPTKAKPCDEQYITVAVGRDYQDVAPTSGYYLGTPASHLTVEVSVVLESSKTLQ